MKKPIILSSVVALSLYANSGSYQMGKGNFNNWSGFAIDRSYQTIGNGGQEIVGNSKDSKYKLVSGFFSSSEMLNSIPEINITNSVTLFEDSVKLIPFTYFDRERSELNISIVKNGDIGTLSQSENSFLYTPYNNRSGLDLVTVKFDDGFGGVVESNISITLLAVDDSPTMAKISDITLNEDDPIKVVELSISDIDTSISTAVIKVSSTNSEIATISTSGQSILITPVTDKFGTASISVTATLGGKSVSQTFSLIINPIDDLPIFSDINDIIVDEDSETKNIQLSLSDIDSDVKNANYSFESSNSDIVDISISGEIIILTPKANKFGSSTITVKATLDEQEALQSFNYTINPIDDTPILAQFENIVNSGIGTISAPISLSDIDSDIKDATYSVTSSNPNLVDVKIVDGEVIITQKENLSGEVEITVTATLDKQEVSQTFIYSTERVNLAPTIGYIEDIELESRLEQFSEVVPLTLSDDIRVESLSATSSNSKLVSLLSDLETSELTLIILPNLVGEAIITLKITDNEDKEATADFKVIVQANKAQLCLANSINELTFETIKGENRDQSYIQTNLYLPETLDSCDSVVNLTWTSSNSTIIDEVGNVYIDIDQDYTIKLTANIESGGFTSLKSFLLTVPKDELTDKIAVQQTFDFLTFETIRGENLKKSEIYSDLNLYNEGLSDTSISWSSSNSAISSDGVVHRDINDSQVELSATIIKNSEIAEKLFQLIVKGKKESDSEIVANDKVWLSIERILNGNRDSASIKTPLTLYEQGINGSDIFWSSSNENIISISGAVTRDIQDRYVELLASLQSGGATETKNFLVKVIKIVEEKVENNTTFNGLEESEGSSTKTISMLFDSDYGEISSSVEIDNNISQDTEVTLSEESIKTVFETVSYLTTTYLNSDGTTESKVEIIDENNNSIESGLKVGVVGGKLSLQNSGDLKVSFETKEAEVKSDGTVSHTVKSKSGKNSTATSKLAGGSISILPTGVQTSYKTISKSKDGEKFIVKAILETDNLSQSKTLFSSTDLLTGETVEFDKTLSDESSFSEETEMEIGENKHGEVEIEIRSKLVKKIKIE